MSIQKIKIKPKYKKENGLYVIDIDNIKIPFKIRERSVVYIPPNQFGGNHKHPRQEAFIGIGEGLEIVWMQNNKKIKEKMNPKGEIFLFTIPSYLSHAVINKSKEDFGILVEYASDMQKDVESREII